MSPVASAKAEATSDESPLVVDTRSKESYEASHISDSVSVPYDEIETGKWHPQEGVKIVFY